jgi:hypothetical protein
MSREWGEVGMMEWWNGCWKVRKVLKVHKVGMGKKRLSLYERDSRYA